MLRCNVRALSIIGLFAAANSGIWCNTSPNTCEFDDIRVQQCDVAMILSGGNMFSTRVKRFYATPTYVGYAQFNGGMIFEGQTTLDGGEMPLCLSQAAVNGSIFINTQAATTAPAVIDEAYQGTLYLQVDDENQADTTLNPTRNWGTSIVRVSVAAGQALELDGVYGSGELPIAPLTRTGFAGGYTGKLTINGSHYVGVDGPCLFNAVDVGNDQAFALAGYNPGQGARGGASLEATVSNRFGAVRLSGTPAPAGNDLADNSTTILFTDGAKRVLRVALTGNRNPIVNPDGMKMGEIMKFIFPAALANTYTLVNGGPAGGNLFVCPVGFAGAVELQFNGTDLVL